MNAAVTTLAPVALLAGLLLYTADSVFADRFTSDEEYRNQVGATLRLINLKKISSPSSAEIYWKNIRRGLFMTQSDEAWMQMMQDSGIERTLLENILHGQSQRNAEFLEKHPKYDFFIKAIRVAEWDDWKNKIQRSAARYESSPKREALELIRGDLDEMALQQQQQSFEEVHRYYAKEAAWLKRHGGSQTIEPDSNIETAILAAMTQAGQKKNRDQAHKKNQSISEVRKVLLRFVGSWRVEEVLVYSDTHQRLLSKQQLSITKGDVPLRNDYSRNVEQLVYSDSVGEIKLSSDSKIETTPSSLLTRNKPWVRKWRVFLEQNKQDFGDAYMAYDNSAEKYILRDFFKNGPREFIFTWDETTQRLLGSDGAYSIHFVDADTWVFTEHMEQRIGNERNRTMTARRIKP